MAPFTYQSIPALSRPEVEAALERDEPAELLRAVLAAALHGEPVWAAGICARLARHPHVNVRGNALLGFGHLARLHGDPAIDRSTVEPLVEAGLRDPEAYVRGQADAAIGDLEHFLGWRSSSRPNPIRDWHEGRAVDGVQFARGERAEVGPGPWGMGRRGTVYGLLELEPEPLYIIEFSEQEGDDARVPQSALRPVA